MPGDQIEEAYLGGQGSRLQAFSSCGGRRLVTQSVSSAVSLVCLFRQVTTASWTPAQNNAWSQSALCAWRGSRGQGQARWDQGLRWGSTASGPGLQTGGRCFPHGREWFAVHIQALCLVVFEEYDMNVYQRRMFLSTAYFTM